MKEKRNDTRRKSNARNDDCNFILSDARALICLLARTQSMASAETATANAKGKTRGENICTEY